MWNTAGVQGEDPVSSVSGSAEGIPPPLVTLGTLLRASRSWGHQLCLPRAHLPSALQPWEPSAGRTKPSAASVTPAALPLDGEMLPEAVVEGGRAADSAASRGRSCACAVGFVRTTGWWTPRRGPLAN